MKTENKSKLVKALFLDVGGVLLTNGWDRSSRRVAAETFGLDLPEMEERHHLTFNTYELGKLGLDEYLDRLVFYTERPFTKNDFREFIFKQSAPDLEMLGLVRSLKSKYRLKIAVVNNEGRELNSYRIQKYSLDNFVDFFISSCFVHFRKPDADIFRVALDIAHVQPSQVIYIEDRPMFVQVAEDQGILGLRHIDYKSTLNQLELWGFNL